MTDSDTAADTTLISRTGIAYFPLALITRVPFAMMVIGVLTLLVAARNSVAEAGFGSATVGIGAAVFGPFIGAAADRYGQRATLLVTAIINSALLTLLAWFAYENVPLYAILGVTFLVGATVPQVSPMSRTRLVRIVQKELPASRRPRTLSMVLAYESAVDEIVFVFGPVVVGLLAVAYGAQAPVLGAAVMTIIFVSAFAFHHTGRLSESSAERALTLAPASHLLAPSLIVVVAGTFSVGLVFGTTLTALTAFMKAHGQAESAGLVYGIMGFGSAILALSVAQFSPRFTLRYRSLVFSAFIVAGLTVFGMSDGLVTVIVALVLAGVGIGPQLVTLYTFGAARSPEGRSATVMTMLGSSIALGQSLAAGVTGTVSEQLGVRVALMLATGAAILTCVMAVINFFLSSPRQGAASADASHVPPRSDAKQ